MNAAMEARQSLPTLGVCRALGLARATFYRKRDVRQKAFHPKSAFEKAPHPRALSLQEREAALAIMHSERFADMAPAPIHATLLDEGRYICSVRTMYRILKENGQVRERRAVASHPKRSPPELVATAPNQVWTWDITHLCTIGKGATLKLYVALDLFSRYAVGWYLSPSESSAEARHLFETLARRERIDRDYLIIHADNGGPMRGQPLADLLESLGIERSHSRPHTSNDNAFSESQFKTMKYRPTYPRRFESMHEAREWCREFFAWYNHEHRHESLAFLTPADVYTGRTAAVLASRAQTLAAAFEHQPNRFVKGAPKPKEPPTQAAINPPPQQPATDPLEHTTQAQEVTK